ncbi:MAG TPA: translocation/assembly module TamB domain-containing protein, partial [Terriglobales bacterium]|nr:translocation/assembly module TamB domain-containing protein [Terriglobales bacterium]
QGHANIDLQGENYTTASFDTKGLPLGPLIALYKPVPEQFKGVLELHATAKGPLKNKDAMEAHVTIPTFSAAYQQLEIANAGPIKADYVNSVVTIAPSELRGTGTSLKFNGEVPLKGSVPPRMTVTGSVNLELLRIVSPDLQSAGQVGLDLHAVRAAEGIGVEGQVKLQNASLSTASSPLGVQNANGMFNIQNNEVRIGELTAQIGGGNLTATGGLTYKPQLRFNLALKAEGVRLRYPEGMRTVLISDLTVNGNADESTVTGRVLIDNVSFTQDFDLGDFIGQFTGTSSPPSGVGMTQNMRLNITVQTTSNVNLVSSTVSLQGQANLRVIGTAANPVIVGRADLTGGEIFLMNKRYQLVRGILNFNNPNETQPVVNVVVTTSVNQYNLNLTFIGPMDRLRTSYTSDPPLPPVDIINLLARGQTTEEAAPANLNANSILAQGLASQVSGRIQKLAGLSALQIDPTIGGNGSDPTARIAIQQRVTKNFIFTFSTDVTDPESQVIQGEYQFNNRWSMTAARTQYGGYAVDAKYHKTF